MEEAVQERKLVDGRINNAKLLSVKRTNGVPCKEEINVDVDAKATSIFFFPPPFSKRDFSSREEKK